jgi:hypothetical protein
MNRSLLLSLTALFALAAWIAAPLAVAKDKDKDEDKGWVELGSRKVDFKGDHDTIDVGKHEGKFTAIRLKVEDGDMVLEKIKVTFGDGSTFEPETRAEFKEGSRSHAIDLPKKDRVIKKVDFTYRSERRREPATIVLSGKEAR